jgi:hypothetical protein
MRLEEAGAQCQLLEGHSGHRGYAERRGPNQTCLGFERMEYELTSDAIELGLDAALPAVHELHSKIGEFGRGERDSPSLTHRPGGFVLINRTARDRAAAELTA